MKVTERNIQIELSKWAMPCLSIHNCHLFGWESDFVQITKAGYVYEFEIKMSRSDFFADFRKTDYYENKRHEILASDQPMQRGWKKMRPAKRAKRFCFVTTEGIVTADDIPEYAGWWEFPPTVSEYDDIRIRNQIAPPDLKPAHKLSADEITRLLKNVTWRYWNLVEAKRRQETQ